MRYCAGMALDHHRYKKAAPEGRPGRADQTQLIKKLPPKGDQGALTRRSTAQAGPVRPSYIQVKAVCHVSGACSLRRRDHRAAAVSRAQLFGAFLCSLFACPAPGSPRAQRHQA